MIKRIATLVAMTFALSGCVKDMDNPESVGKGGLMLNASIDGMAIAETRAAATDADLKTYGFYLAGYHTAGKMDESVADAYPNVFNHDAQDAQDPVPLVAWANQKFTLKTIKWALDETTYLSFFGWSQSKPIPTSGVTTETTGIFAFTKASTDKGYPWIDIRNANAPADQTDVVGSSSVDHKNDAVLSAVDLDFRHLMSKLTFKAKSSSKANIVFTAVNIKYAANKVYKKARYTFGRDGNAPEVYSSFAEYHTGTAALNTSYPVMTNGAEVALGCGLLIPQALSTGAVSLEIKYKLSPNSGSLPGDEQTKTLPLSALTLVQGTNYIYTINVQATGIFVLADPVIEPWVVSGTSLPVVSGPKGDVLLLLDGYDKPYQHTDGKQYWLDRSGYNRHVALSGGYLSYNAAQHGYVFGSSAAGGAIPTLAGGGALGDLTADLVCEHTSGGAYTNASSPFKISGTYSYSLELAPSGGTNVNLRYTNNLLSWTAASVAEIDKLTYWSLVMDDQNNKAYIYRNASPVATSSSAISSSSANTGVLSPSYAGRISLLKITKSALSATEISTEGERLSSRYGTPKPAPPKPPVEYVTIGVLKWTVGNLVADGNNSCKVGAPTDFGLYFQFGSLIGWNGGANGDGTGKGWPSTTVQRVWPLAMGTAQPSFTWRTNNEANISTLTDYYFNYSVAPWNTNSSDISPFAVSISGAESTGMLSAGRYAALAVGDPCTYYLGDPWRVPTKSEYENLIQHGTTAVIANGDVYGRWFGVNAGTPTSSVFVIASGYRDAGTGNVAPVEKLSCAWSITRTCYLRSDGSIKAVWNIDNSCGFPVRCVSK